MSDPKIQGEGDYESGRRYNERVTDFVREGKVEPAVEQARTDDPAEAAQLEEAERAGRERAKEEDLLLQRGQRGDADDTDRPRGAAGDARGSGGEGGERPGEPGGRRDADRAGG